MAASNTIEWIVILLFFVLFWAFTAAEALWLSKRGWATLGRASGFAIGSNLIGFFVGTFVVFVTFMLMMMLAFEPTKNATTTEVLMWIGVGLSLVFPPIFLLLVKRLLLKLFSMDTGRRAWAFSTVSSFLIVYISVLVPALAFYIALKIF